ncbi:GRL1A polymerase, partial [Paradoxornis webbianus]|nr:GRL1A polymerase [Sinosuthora webbiana]
FLFVCFRKFIARLPDKGKKISDFVEKLKLAIFQEEEVARTAELLSAVRLEFQAKQEEINTSKQEVVLTEDTANSADSSVCHENSNIKGTSDISAERQEAECVEEDATDPALENQRTQRKNNKVKTVTKDQNSFCEVVSESATSNHLNNDQQVSQSNTEDSTASTAALDSSKEALVD